jgi:hypothetical protein
MGNPEYMQLTSLGGATALIWTISGFVLGDMHKKRKSLKRLSTEGEGGDAVDRQC